MGIMAASTDEPYRSSLDIPSDTDVLIGPGVSSDSHAGNIVFRLYIDEKKEQYRAQPRGGRLRGEMISNTINHFKAIGRFLEYAHDRRGWIEVVDDRKLRKKVASRFNSSEETVFSHRMDASRITTIPVGLEVACTMEQQTQQQSHSHQSINKDSSAFDGQLQSRVFCDFLNQNPDLNPLLLKIYDSLFQNPTRDPSTPGEGICLSVDSCCGATPRVSIHRPTYSRQNYGRDVLHVATENTKTVNRYTYGVRSGSITHGIPHW